MIKCSICKKELIPDKVRYWTTNGKRFFCGPECSMEYNESIDPGLRISNANKSK